MVAGRWEWTFPLRSLERVLELTGKPIEFAGSDAKKIMSHSPNVKATVTTEPWKGKDAVEIMQTPMTYKVLTHQKEETGDGGFRIRQAVYEIPKENVAVLWNIIRRQPLKKKVRTRTVAKNLVEFLGITRFHRDTGSFDFARFFGIRYEYKRRLYYPLKVLHHAGVVKHHKAGQVERLSDKWTAQTKVRKL